MNVDLLKDNPDWRWFILFGGTLLIVTLVGWLVFRLNPVRGSPRVAIPPLLTMI